MKLPHGVRIGLLSNGQRTVIPGADDVISPGEHVTLVGTREQIEEVKNLFEHKAAPRLKVIIAGGGETGYHLARLLEKGRFSVVVLESDEKRCDYLAHNLDETTVLCADATQLSEMEEARVGKADAFVAATGHDEDNIVCGVEARELGSKRILSVVRRPDYANVLEKLGIDVAVSPREVMARQVLGMVEAGPIMVRSLISGGDAEVWEVEVAERAPITEAPLKEIDLDRSLIAAVEFENYIRVPGADDQLKPGETAVVLVQKDSVAKTLRLFQPPSARR